MPDLGEWPPVYDAEELAATIKQLVDSGLKHFFQPNKSNPVLSQGDIIRLECPLPAIDEAGRAVIIGQVLHWLLLGNTCDLERDVGENPWSQMVPLDPVPRTEVSSSELAQLQHYGYYKRFYVPEWAEDSSYHFVADFTRPVTVHKRALLEVAEVEARLSRSGWFLLHSCLVRFLARGDGREATETG